MSEIFRKLDDQEFFKGFLTEQLNRIPTQMASILECRIKIDPDKVDYAFGAYKINVRKFTDLVYSADPDHYKRSGAMLQALVESQPISLEFVTSLDDLETGFSPIHMRFRDTVEEMPFARYFDEYANELNAFILCYELCSLYEQEPRRFTQEYLETMCAYLKGERNHPVEALYMIFKSLMH